VCLGEWQAELQKAGHEVSDALRLLEQAGRNAELLDGQLAECDKLVQEAAQTEEAALREARSLVVVGGGGGGGINNHLGNDLEALSLEEARRKVGRGPGSQADSPTCGAVPRAADGHRGAAGEARANVESEHGAPEGADGPAGAA
jgi:DNA repair ATPase RecN